MSCWKHFNSLNKEEWAPPSLFIFNSLFYPRMSSCSSWSCCISWSLMNCLSLSLKNPNWCSRSFLCDSTCTTIHQSDSITLRCTVVAPFSLSSSRTLRWTPHPPYSPLSNALPPSNCCLWMINDFLWLERRRREHSNLRQKKKIKRRPRRLKRCEK